MVSGKMLTTRGMPYLLLLWWKSICTFRSCGILTLSYKYVSYRIYFLAYIKILFLDILWYLNVSERCNCKLVHCDNNFTGYGTEADPDLVYEIKQEDNELIEIVNDTLS